MERCGWFFHLILPGSIFDSVSGADFRELTDEEAKSYGGPCTG
ncbi:MAG: hypothetical protein ACLUD2_16625 [Clostridium sp.]